MERWLGGIELGGLIEVAGEVLPGKVFGFGAAEIELSLRRPPGGMKERRGGRRSGPEVRPTGRVETGLRRVIGVQGPRVGEARPGGTGALGVATE